MNNNILGMDPELAKAAAIRMESIKNKLKDRVEKSDNMIRERINSAFSGKEVSAMDGFVGRVHASLDNLYRYLDSESTESSFAIAYHKTIQSYEQSDDNVARSYNNYNIEQ